MNGLRVNDLVTFWKTFEDGSRHAVLARVWVVSSSFEPGMVIAVLSVDPEKFAAVPNGDVHFVSSKGTAYFSWKSEPPRSGFPGRYRRC